MTLYACNKCGQVVDSSVIGGRPEKCGVCGFEDPTRAHVAQKYGPRAFARVEVLR